MRKIVISLGGSVIVPDKFNIAYLKGFKRLITSFIKKGYKFVIICGGGSTARRYQKALAGVIGNNQEAMDLVGISATHLNASLLRAIFHNSSDKDIIINPTEKISSKKSIIIAGGWKPGFSTDYDAVLLAKNFKASLVNITNVDYVYDKNPAKSKDAEPIKNIVWKDFRKLVSKKWKAGLNAPFDPIAAKEAEKSKLNVAVIGKDLGNLRNFLNGKKFKGTLIR